VVVVTAAYVPVLDHPDELAAGCAVCENEDEFLDLDLGLEVDYAAEATAAYEACVWVNQAKSEGGTTLPYLTMLLSRRFE